MSKINIHILLKDYHDHPYYPEIAQFAGKMSRTSTKKEILEAVARRYTIRNLPSMREKNQPIELFGELGIDIPYNAYEQMRVAMSIPPATRGAMMPDAHHGYSVPIGGVVELENAISPAYIGFDISCMVMLTILNISPDDFMAHREMLANDLRFVTSFGVGSAFDKPQQHRVMSFPQWDEFKLLKDLKQKAASQLGSSGGGNHFADLVIGKRPNGTEFVALMTHSGSRGTGHKIATYYTRLADKETKHRAKKIPSGYGWLDMRHDSGREYQEMMLLMGDYALANHQVIHQNFIERSKIFDISTIWNRHNFAWKNDNLYVHRKGATPAGAGVHGIIPGTSGTNSYLVRGLGNQDSLFSSSHGAGRPFSRTQAKKQHDPEKFKSHMAEKDILSFGLAPDETFLAYKDIETVMARQEGILFDTVATLQPKVVIMGGKSDDGD